MLNVNTVMSLVSDADVREDMMKLFDYIDDQEAVDLLEKIVRTYEGIIDEQREEVATVWGMLDESSDEKEIVEEEVIAEEEEVIVEEELQEEEVVVEEVATETVEDSVIFNDNDDENENKLIAILEYAYILKEKVAGLNSDINNKIVDNLIEKINKLIDKNSEKHMSSEKLTSQFAKILKQTVLKLIELSEVKSMVIDFMNDCGIRKLDWSVGRKLTDDEWAYLDDATLFVDVDDASKSGTIIEVSRNAFIIDYCEDGEKYESIIPAICEIGRKIK